MHLAEELQQLEATILQPEVRRNPDALSALLCGEFREFGSSGRIYDRQEILDLLRTEEPVAYSICGFDATLLAPGVALVTYQASRQDLLRGRRSLSLRSSLWVKRDGRWQ